MENFWRGWKKDGEHERPKTFLKYFLYYPINLICVVAYSGFIALFVEGGIRYESELIWTATLFPLIVLAYHVADEWFAFQWYTTGVRKVSSVTLQSIAKWSCGAVMLYLVVRVFITG